MTLTPAQQEVLDVLRAGDRPEVDASLRTDLRRRLEEPLAERAASLSKPLFASKHAISRVLACEAHELAERGEFAWNLASARGTVAHKAIQITVGRADRPPPLQVVDDAIERLAADPNENIADFLLGLTDAERAELRSDVNNVVAAFVELWPPLQPSWRPQTEARCRAELCGGKIVLSGRVDLSLGAATGLQAGRVVVDLKTGGRHGAHVDDLRFYALLDTLRCGVPPFRLVSYYLESGMPAPEDVTEHVLEAAVRRTVAAVTKLAELELGLRSPSRTPNPACGWCSLRDECDGARAWEDERTDR